MRKIFNAILVICWFSMSIFCSCVSGKCKIIKYKNVTYKISEGKAYAIGPEQQWANSSLIINRTIPGYEVEGIADSAFFKEGRLEKVIIEEGIKYVGKYAFAECEHLSDVTLPNSVKEIKDGVFKGCKALKYVSFTDSLISIGDSAFYDTAFPELVFPPHLKKIGVSAFEDILFCRSSTLCFPSDLIYIGKRAFRNTNFSSLLLPKNLEYIGEEAFSHYGTNLKSLYIPEKVSYIGVGAFSFCCIEELDISPKNESFIVVGGCLLSKDRKILRAVSEDAKINGALVVPDGVECLEEFGVILLDDFQTTKRIVLPNSLKSLSARSVWIHSYSDVSKIYIPQNVETIEVNAFDECQSVVLFEVDPANKYFSSQEGVLFDKMKERLVKYPAGNSRKKYIVPLSVKTIDRLAFSYCKNLHSLNISNTKKLGERTCYDCKKLSEVICPKVDSVMQGAICWCGDALTCYMGENIRYIDEKGVGNLRKLYCKAENPPYINGETLSTEKWSKIYVPSQSVYCYQRDAKWGKLNIVPIQ